MSQPNSHIHLIVLLPLLLISHFVNLSYSQKFDFLDVCNADDKQVLLRIKAYLGNPPSLKSWDLANDCGGPWEVWHGVKCDGEGRISSLLFFGLQDIYRISPFLDELPALRGLGFVYMTNLFGPIPYYIGKLTNLSSLTIAMTNISGPIPSFLGRLTNLGNLDLSSNKFSGPIPNFLRRLNSVTTLDLSNNKITGPLPISLGLITQLSWLSLLNNQLTGPVPRSLGGGNIIVIRLGNNKLTGDATFLIDKSNNDVIEVDISNNQFKFDMTNVDLAPRLYAMNISHNMIYGRLPKLFYRKRDFLGTYIDITYNELCGPIPNGRLLKRVDPNLFAHNKCLCGGPLPACK
ncbi:polygalacturonase inhibitor 2-like [Silene latifolia]|uniref:polygalacturonase inhibitor 2-like n=1 Tax=Silene latifolia TaxID=37657 RepID=UPI003D789261